MEHGAYNPSNGTTEIMNSRNLRDINKTTSLLMEERLQYIQKEINEIY